MTTDFHNPKRHKELSFSGKCLAFVFALILLPIALPLMFLWLMFVAFWTAAVGIRGNPSTILWSVAIFAVLVAIVLIAGFVKILA